MAIPPIATIRSSPKEIKATETYHMELNLISYLSAETLEKSGKIEISVPYDGNVHVTKESTEDLTAQMRYEYLPRRSRALIGYLNLQNHVKTDLDAQYNLSLNNDILPIDIGLKERGLRYLDSLREDKFEQFSEIRYAPDDLYESPLALQFFITDEILKRDFTEEIMPKFKKHLYLGFDIVLNTTPAQMDILKKDDVELFDFRMDWINIPATERVTACITCLDDNAREDVENTAVFYDAETQQIVCPKIKLIKNEPQNQFYTRLLIEVPEPMGLYKEHYKEKPFTGTAQFKFPFLLSGLHLSYYKTTGEYEPDLTIKTESKLLLKFKLDIFDYFRRKWYVPSQLLQFPRVILDDMRVKDIETILRDENFIEIKQQTKKFPNSRMIDQVILSAERKEGAGTLRIRIILMGRRTLTEREKAIPGDEKFITKFPTGGFDCRIQGELKQDSQTVVNLLNKIHTIMKERFHHVSILD